LFSSQQCTKMHYKQKELNRGDPKKESLSGTPTQFRGSRRNYRSGTTTVRWAIIIAALAHVVSATTESIRLSKREAAYYEPCRLNPLWPDRTRVEGDTNAPPTPVVQATEKVHKEPKKKVDPKPKSPETSDSKNQPRKTSQRTSQALVVAGKLRVSGERFKIDYNALPRTKVQKPVQPTSQALVVASKLRVSGDRFKILRRNKKVVPKPKKKVPKPKKKVPEPKKKVSEPKKKVSEPKKKVSEPKKTHFHFNRSCKWSKSLSSPASGYSAALRNSTFYNPSKPRRKRHLIERLARAEAEIAASCSSRQSKSTLKQ